VLENGRWRCRSKSDLLASAGYFSTRIFLWRSSASSGLDGHLAGPFALSWSARDLHTPRVFFLALARAGYGLFLRLRQVQIWTSEGRSLMGGLPEKSSAQFERVFSAVCFLACLPEFLLVVVVYSFLFHSLPVSGSCFKLGFPPGLVVSRFFTF
jgi:hypothetical protein